MTGLAAEHRQEPERPRDRICPVCGGVVKPVMVPWLGGRNRWVVSNVCKTCSDSMEKSMLGQDEGELVKDLLKNAGLPQVALNRDFEKAKAAARRIKSGGDLELWEKAYNTVRWRYHEGLYLYGPAGLGKSVLACCAIVAHIYTSRTPGLFVSVTELLTGIRDSYAKSSEARLLVDRGKRVGLLVLDEVGFARPREREYKVLVSLVEARLGRRLPTIYTSNYHPGELEKRFRDKSARLVDRVIESAGVKFEGKSFRVIDAEKKWQA